jgi:hypothetical protein
MDDLVLIPGRGKDFPVLQNVKTESGVQPASYLMVTGGSVPEGKVAGLGGALLSSAKVVKEWRTPPPHPPVCLNGMHWNLTLN